MHPSQVPEKPLTASANPKSEAIERVYFFEKSNGEIVFASKEGAWNMYSRFPQIVGERSEKPRFIGSSDGALYQKAQHESRQIMAEKGLEAAQARLRLGVEEELAVARGNMVPPPNLDKMGSGAFLI